MRALACATAVILLALPAWAQSPNWDIALFGDAACSTCNVEIPAGQSADVYIVGQAFVSPGIIGAEFRVIGLPADWTYVVTPSPLASVALGDPLGNGANIAFANMQTGTCIFFYRLTITAASAMQNVALEVVRHTSPSNPQFSCPIVTVWCGEPCVSKVCVPGRGMTINAGHDCTVAAHPSTWSTVKSLYSAD